MVIALPAYVFLCLAFFHAVLRRVRAHMYTLRVVHNEISHTGLCECILQVAPSICTNIICHMCKNAFKLKGITVVILKAHTHSQVISLF